jgi:ubiquinone/menaquinone biosynthesis C-methylase UbiE
MSKTKTGQVNTTAAEIYEEFFIPALFQEWAIKVADEASIQPGQRVLDVACGTGVLTREVANRIGSSGSVVGLDMNQGMLAVARKKSPDIEWCHDAAEAIPFSDKAFDRVISQFGLMFFSERVSALQEMLRVLKNGGHLTIAVWDSLENATGYRAVVDLLQRLFGEQAAEALRSPYSLGNTKDLKNLFDRAGISNFEIKTLPGKANFPSIESWMFTDVKGWTLADLIDEKQYQQLLTAAENELKQFVQPDGTVAFDHPAHIIKIKK